MYRSELIALSAVWLAAACSCGVPDGDQPRPVESGSTGGLETADTSGPVVHTGDTSTAETGLVPELAWQSAHTGAWFSCGVVSDGTIRCWGDPDCRMGAPSPDPEQSPVFTEVSVGVNEACTVDEDGALSCWCCGLDRDLCDEVPEGTFERVVTSYGYACAQTPEGLLQCFGKGPRWLNFGSIPTVAVTDFDVELGLACAVVVGEIQCWGSRDPWYGGPPPAGVEFAQVGLGRGNGCGLDTAGQAYCWGVTDGPEPFPDPPSGTFATIDVYGATACVLDATGAPTCWVAHPELGPYAPAFVVPDELFDQINLGEWAGCGVTVDGRALCWGLDSGAGETIVPEL